MTAVEPRVGAFVEVAPMGGAQSFVAVVEDAEQGGYLVVLDETLTYHAVEAARTLARPYKTLAEEAFHRRALAEMASRGRLHFPTAILKAVPLFAYLVTL